MRTLRTLTPIAAAALLVGVASCSSGGTGSSSAVFPMQRHWEAGQALQHAMVRGDLTAARRAAAAIAEVEDIPGLPPDGGAYLTRMRNEAQAVVDAAQFADAARATGRMAASCGSCHLRAEDGPDPEGSTTAPSVGPEDTQYHMLRHTWALDRMWEGLILPSWDRWRAGARILAEQPIAAVGMSPEVGLMAARVHEMGRQALDDDNTMEQADRFGRILQDCAGCHAELGLH